MGDAKMLTAWSPTRRTGAFPRRGIVLIALLMMIITITVLSLEYLCRSDLELACARNLMLRTQMDALAQSGLEHARGLLLHPQGIPQEYWTGGPRHKLAAGSDDFYDVQIVKLREGNYQIVSTAYRLQQGERLAHTTLKAELRLDPCLAYWQGAPAVLPRQVTVVGDVYCGDRLRVEGRIEGDAFAAATITVSGHVSGHQQESVSSAPVAFPGLAPTDFGSHYYVQHQRCQVDAIPGEVLDSVQLHPTAANPSGIHFSRGDLVLRGHVEIEGMLVVSHDLVLQADCEVVIRAVKNFPALVVGHDVTMTHDHQRLQVEGLAQIGHSLSMGNRVGGTVEIAGALCLASGSVEEAAGGALRVRAASDKAAIQLWPTAGVPWRWSPAAGAFFKSIERL